MRRTVDVVIASMLLLVTAPMMALIALAVLVLTGTPVLCRDRYLGQDGQPFERLRFRTLRYGRGPELTRLTPLGARLRVRGLDQLPQLWNVLRGDMSVVGPRPITDESLAAFDEFQRRRLQVRPGLVGPVHLLQSDSVSSERELLLEAEYVEHRSILLDLAIIRRWLALMVLRRSGWSPSANTNDILPAESGRADTRAGRQAQPGERSGAG
ncbi:MAG: sugar transferase [Acidimicrobiia bacterium]|nr:sugar transferase [Acidimicrobiia bacterium]MDH4364244.1 sugar transferase [Acidimicrobiia bacterium]